MVLLAGPRCVRVSVDGADAEELRGAVEPGGVVHVVHRRHGAVPFDKAHRDGGRRVRRPKDLGAVVLGPGDEAALAVVVVCRQVLHLLDVAVERNPSPARRPRLDPPKDPAVTHQKQPVRRGVPRVVAAVAVRERAVQHVGGIPELGPRACRGVHPPSQRAGVPCDVEEPRLLGVAKDCHPVLRHRVFVHRGWLGQLAPRRCGRPVRECGADRRDEERRVGHRRVGAGHREPTEHQRVAVGKHGGTRVKRNHPSSPPGGRPKPQITPSAATVGGDGGCPRGRPSVGVGSHHRARARAHRQQGERRRGAHRSPRGSTVGRPPNAAGGGIVEVALCRDDKGAVGEFKHRGDVHVGGEARHGPRGAAVGRHHQPAPVARVHHVPVGPFLARR
mmetsp:Transcript_14976/g.38444  ORF Transcript_14976/g.38444 Transcript_14976/m.38444 type:complete len:389 (-) Transcript_14976:437-1603(-)